LCPRVKKKKLNIDPDTLVPKLPNPKLLKPFPTNISIKYEGHASPVLSVSVSLSGEYLATGDQSGFFIVWDVLSSRKLFTKQYHHPIYCIDWSVGNIIVFSHGE
jgi:ribosome biogenesis protein ERB1